MNADKLNPAFVAALKYYGSFEYQFEQPTTFVYRDDKGENRSEWPVEKTCALAFKVIDEEELYRLKFACLAAGLKQYGLSSVYKAIMNEDIPS